MALFAKLWTDVLDDPKLMSAARRGAKHLSWLPWLIVYAKRADDDGCLTIDGKPAEPVDIARSIPNATANRIRSAVVELENLGVLDRRTNGALHFSAWNVRNTNKLSDSKEEIARRVREHRERKRKSHNTEGNDGNALQGVTGNGDVTRQSESESGEVRARARNKSESETPPAAALASHQIAGELPPAALQLLERITPPRRPTVEREMRRFLGAEGMVYRGHPLRGDIQRLNAKCGETLAALRAGGEIANVWSYTLSKLADTSDGSAPGAQAHKMNIGQAVHDAAMRATEDFEDFSSGSGAAAGSPPTNAEDLKLAEDWLAQRPTIATSIDEQLEREGFSGGDDVMNYARRIARRGYTLAAWRDHNPSSLGVRTDEER